MKKPNGIWKEFKGQALNTGDLLMLKSGLAFVDSKYTSMEPSVIQTIPQKDDQKIKWSWSYFFNNGSINDRKRNENGDAFISMAGWIHRSKEYSKILGPRVDRILFVFQLKSK